MFGRRTQLWENLGYVFDNETIIRYVCLRQIFFLPLRWDHMHLHILYPFILNNHSYCYIFFYFKIVKHVY